MLMTTQFRRYTKQAGITEDYHRVREFFVRLGYAEFTYARWDWMITHTYLDKSAIGRIGVWEDRGEIVGIATFDGELGNAFCLALPEYVCLKRKMLLYGLPQNGIGKGCCPRGYSPRWRTWSKEGFGRFFATVLLQYWLTPIFYLYYMESKIGG